MSRGSLALALAAALVAAALVAVLVTDRDEGDRTAADASTSVAPPEPPPETAPEGPATPTGSPPPAAREVERPVVWIQAGHAEPREPGYRAQTGAGAGPFGGEVGFTTRLAPAIVARLRAAGVDARETPGEVTPNGAPGAAFVSVHHDAPGGQAIVGAASTGGGENYYHGEGVAPPSPTPYSDSAPHRAATMVSPEVAARSKVLADDVARSFGAIYTPANGARASFAGASATVSNTRVGNYYGFYRSSADARIIIEAGAARSDDAFLADVDLLAEAIAAGILANLRGRGLVS